MKTLYLIRHGKSSWSDPSLDDFDRPLKKRGKKEAPMMGKVLQKKGSQPDLMVSSPAKRAWKTALAFAEKLNVPEDQVRSQQEIYEADEEDLLEIIKAFDNSFHEIALVGHNPALTDLACSLTGMEIDNVPTSGVVGIRFLDESWNQVANDTGEPLFFEYPSMYR